MLTPIDRYFAAKCIKKEIDEAYRNAESEAAIYLDEARGHGMPTLTSTYFGEDAGEYKRGKTRVKHVVEFSLSDSGALEKWVEGNTYTAFLFLKDYASEFGSWCMTMTGEIPDGIEMDEHDEPPRVKAPQVYRYNHGLIKAKLAEGGNILEGANRLLLGDGDE